ncbi:hypothetical protein ACH4NT_30580 [Streptomyces lydicus]|uniref:hypothetical protein n=1 Tax=Streptomyces lydicus TaxID=47763 RepID=UPI0037954639
MSKVPAQEKCPSVAATAVTVVATAVTAVALAAVGRRAFRPSVKQTARSLLARTYPNVGSERLDEAAELLAQDLESEAPEPEEDDLTAAEAESVELLRHLLANESPQQELLTDS